MRTTFVAVCSLVLGVGCVENIVEVRPQAAAVKVVKEDDRPFRCTIVGDIHGVARSQDEAKARKGAENDMRNQAASLRGNYAMVEIDRAKNVGITSYQRSISGRKSPEVRREPGLKLISSAAAHPNLRPPRRHRWCASSSL